MATITLQASMGTDGRLHLEMPGDLPEGPINSIVVVYPPEPGPPSTYGVAQASMSDLTHLDDSRIQTDLREMLKIRYAVKCPRCRGKAAALMAAIGNKGTYREPEPKMGVRRLTCGSCGLSKEVSPGRGHYELWYATQFRGHRVWAINEQHLAWLISWLSGPARQPHVRSASAISHPRFLDRVRAETLPKWMLQAGNRRGLLKCLRTMLEA